MKIPQIVRYVQFIWIGINERLLNISTSDQIQYEEPPGWIRGPKTDKARHQDNLAYGTADYYYIYKTLRLLKLGNQDVVYDIGCGKGRIISVIGRKSVKKCVGIEMLEDLCNVAKTNVERLRGRRCPIEVRCEDAAVSDMSDGTAYCLFNPFGVNTLREVLKNLENSLLKNPRPIRLVYYNSSHRAVFESYKWLRLSNTFNTLNGLKVDFYETVPGFRK